MTTDRDNLLDPWHRTWWATVSLNLSFIRLAFLKFMAYRLRYYTGVISYSIFVTGHYYVYQALFAAAVAESGQETIGGFRLAEMITYVAISWIGRSFYFNNIGRELARLIQEGEIAVMLVKPYDVQSVMMFEAIGESCFRLLMFTVPIMVVIVPLFGIQGAADPGLYGYTFLSFCLAMVIYSQINFLLGCLAFGMKNIQGVMRAKMVSMDFLTGVIVPFSFFPDWWQQVMAWLPFQYINYVPVTIYLGKRTGSALVEAILIQFFWATALYLVGRVVWRHSVKRLVVQGG